MEGTTLVKKREQADAEQGRRQSSAPRARVYAQTILPRLMVLERKYTIGPVDNPHFAVLELNHVFGDPPDPNNEDDLEGWCYTGEFKGDFFHAFKNNLREEVHARRVGLSVGDLAILHVEERGKFWYLCTAVLAVFRGNYSKSVESALRAAGMHGHPCMHDIQLLSMGKWKCSDSHMAITPKDTKTRAISGRLQCKMGIWLFPTGVDIGVDIVAGGWWC